jgi:CBS domain-containing protein
MVRDAYIVDLETPLDEVLDHMAANQIGSAIVTRQGKLAGVFTTTDACRSFAEFLREQSRHPGGDAA